MEKILIAVLGLAIMPLFILHFPDYILCLPIWFYQRRKILKKNRNSDEIVKDYENSLLFTHEMLYFPLSGLHKIMSFMADNKKIGIKETVKRIDYLYWFTFQQKQAQKAIITLGKYKETALQYIHFLLEENNFPLLKTLAESNPMADLYLLLFEKTADLTPVKKYALNISISPAKFFPSCMRTKEKRPYSPGTLQERVEIVYREMSKEQGYHFNNEILKTLEAAHKFLTSSSLKDFYEGCDTLEVEIDFPTDIKYFSDIRHMIPQLKKIKSDLLKIESIESFETKRSFMDEQKKSLEVLSKSAGENLYEPFKHIWTEALKHCAELISQEIKLLRSSAVLAIGLKNNEILASEKERRLYFEIRNKGQELSTDVLISVQSDSPVVSFSSTNEAGIDVIESGSMKEISFPIAAPTPGKTTVKGTLAFSDRTKAGKKIDFSFPITILKKRVEFKEIKNPYIVGQPLRGETPLFFGRDDVYQFIDKNIMVSDNHQTIVCHGLRRTGKTSLLYLIEDKGFTDKRLVPVNIDMQGVDDEKDFYYTLSSTIVEKLSLPALSLVENFSQFKKFLKNIKPKLVEKILVLMVDEFEAIQELVENKKITKIIFNNIRHLMQHENQVIFLFCGTHKLEEMSADYWSIFFNTAIYQRISHLKHNDAIRLIKEPVKGQLTYDDLAVEQILKMTGGQPYLTQLICRTLVNDLNENKKRNDALIDDVDDAVEQIISGGTEHFSQHIWDESSLLEHLILSAAAEELTHKQLDFIGLDAIYDKIQPLTGKFSKKQVIETLDKLVAKEILNEKNMRYCFPVNLLRKWIAARYPLRKVREEIER